MKKYLFCLLTLMLIYQSSYAQTYHKLLDTNKLWNYYDIYSGPNPHYTHLYRFTTDTTINGKKYFIPEITLDSINWFKENYFFREEDSTKRVYLLYNNNEGLLYDFSLNTGDSVTILNTLTSIYQPVTIHVVSIDSIQIDGFYRKIIHTDFFSYTWIEGIGDIMGLTHPGDMSTGVALNLVCYYENNLLKYANPDYESCFYAFLNVVENDKENQLLIRTIDQNSFIISSDEMINDITLINLFGEQLADFSVRSCQFSLDLSAHAPGVYFVKCNIKNRTAVFKIIKP
ncbi:MAG TPA: T9SS type A sorting domain-containing protein [Bacteroidales bacterium]|nr:T9SS type A sorting domain-containing protein [Bacteroidales bacterium]